MNVAFIIIMVFCTAVHLTSTLVVGIFAIHRVKFLAFAVVMALITAALASCTILFFRFENPIDLGIMHPCIILPLLASAFLESMYPVSLVMPGYLQWRRMVLQSSPILFIIAVYAIASIAGDNLVIKGFSDVGGSLLKIADLTLRIVSMLLALYYILSVVLLPRMLLRSQVPIPAYLAVYCTLFGITYGMFFLLSLRFAWWILYFVICLLTFVNVSLVLQSLENIAEVLPLPKRAKVSETQELDDGAPADFNEENHERFLKAEHFMQESDEWQDVGFTRDRLCEVTGINRHLLLQSLRSQGYNNVHEYITTYRVEYLRRQILSRPDDSLTQICFHSGFATLVTARGAYRKILGRDLDSDYEMR